MEWLVLVSGRAGTHKQGMPDLNSLHQGSMPDSVVEQTNDRQHLVLLDFQVNRIVLPFDWASFCPWI